MTTTLEKTGANFEKTGAGKTGAGKAATGRPGDPPVPSRDQLTMDLPLTDHERRQMERCEAVIREGMRKFVQVGTAFRTIRDGRLYRATHRSFEAYVEQNWGLRRSSAYRLMDAVSVVDNLATAEDAPDRGGAPTLENVSPGPSPIGGAATAPPGLPPDVPLPANEAQARPLSGLTPGEQREAWRRALEISREIAGPGTQPTATVVQRAVDELHPHHAVKAPAAQPPLFVADPQERRFASPGPEVPAPGDRTAGSENEVAGNDGAIARAVDDADWESGYGQKKSVDGEEPDTAGGDEAPDGAEDEPPVPAAAGARVEADPGGGQAGESLRPRAVPDHEAALVDAADAAGGDGTPAAAGHAVVPAPQAPVQETSIAHTPKVVAPAKAAPLAPATPATPAPPPLPPGWTTAMVREEDVAALQAEGLWPLGNVRQELAALRAQAEMAAPSAPTALPDGWTTAMVRQADVEALQGRQLWPLEAVIQRLGALEALRLEDAAPARAPLWATAAAELAALNATGDTVLTNAETDLLDELFPGREATAPEHIVTAIAVRRLRGIQAMTEEAG